MPPKVFLISRRHNRIRLSLIVKLQSELKFERIASLSRNFKLLGKIGTAGMGSYAAHSNVDTNVNEIVFLKLEAR